MQVRPRHGSATVLLDASSNDNTTPGTFTLDTVDGFASITVTFDSADLVGMTWTQGVYDIEIVDTVPNPPRVERLVEGEVVLSREVTTRA